MQQHYAIVKRVGSSLPTLGKVISSGNVCEENGNEHRNDEQ